MGISTSSLLDEAKSKHVKDQADSILKEFSPYYREQFSVARFSQVEDDLEQDKQKITQLLLQKEAPKDSDVLFEDSVFYFDETRKWRDRYVVVRANYCLECHENLECFVKGLPLCHKLLPTGGAIVTTEAEYVAMVDKCFPIQSDTSAKEEFAPPVTGMPGQFPVYLRLPYRRDSYFCFKQQAREAAFISILSDCIRHQNQDFLKKNTCEVQAFLKAIQHFRQDKGKYEDWDMLIGSDNRVLANLVMEQLLPTLQKDFLPGLKARKTEKKKVWFATVEAAYILIQEHLLEGLTALKEECRTAVQQQEVLIHSDMDHIVNFRQQLEEKIRAKVSEPAETLYSESIQPYLGSVLEELMEPISSGFQDGRQLSETMMDQVCQDVVKGADNEQIKKALADMARPNLLSCYQKIGSLQDKLQHLQQRFGFSSLSGVIHSAQIDLQQLMENAAYTFEQLLYKAIQDNPENAGSAIEKAKHRVLKQFNYDSSTVWNRLSQDAVVSIILPFIKKNLASTCSTELQSLGSADNSDFSSFIKVENVYDGFLKESLLKHVTREMKEKDSLKKYNLCMDRSGHSSLSSPMTSTPGSPTLVPSSIASTELPPTSPLVVNGLSSSAQQKEEELLLHEVLADTTVLTVPLGEVEQKEEAPSIEAKAGIADTPEKPEVMPQIKTEVKVIAPRQQVQEVIRLVNDEAEAAVEPEIQRPDFLQGQETTLSQPSTSVGIVTEAATAAPPPKNESANLEETRPQPAARIEEETHSESSAVKLESPSSGEALEEVGLNVPEEKAEAMIRSGTSSLAVSVGSESGPSDPESYDEVSTSDILENDPNISESPMSSDSATKNQTASEELSSPVQTESTSSGDIKSRASKNTETSAEAAPPHSAEPTEEVVPSSPKARPPDCIKEIRDLVVEVIEVKEPIYLYPGGVPKEE
ncbi:protein Niban 1a [Pholidichthys leucotaenia]